MPLQPPFSSRRGSQRRGSGSTCLRLLRTSMRGMPYSALVCQIARSNFIGKIHVVDQDTRDGAQRLEGSPCKDKGPDHQCDCPQADEERRPGVKQETASARIRPVAPAIRPSPFGSAMHSLGLGRNQTRYLDCSPTRATARRRRLEHGPAPKPLGSCGRRGGTWYSVLRPSAPIRRRRHDVGTLLAAA
jgi:hypothetical protein